MFRDNNETGSGSPELAFNSLVERFYRPLYQFALNLTQSEADAWDLTQQTFYVWAVKGRQLRDASKVKSWMFTTLHRAFLQRHRHQARFPHRELGEAESELPPIPAPRGTQLDAAQVRQALRQVDTVYQVPVALFYLQERPYKEIARLLNVPIGTVASRIARGLNQLRELLVDRVVPGTEESRAV